MLLFGSNDFVTGPGNVTFSNLAHVKPSVPNATTRSTRFMGGVKTFIVNPKPEVRNGYAEQSLVGCKPQVPEPRNSQCRSNVASDNAVVEGAIPERVVDNLRPCRISCVLHT